MSCSEKQKKKCEISATSKMRRQLTGDIPNMIIFYGIYELGAAKLGMVETDPTKY
jgi:hypothetical protein